MPELFPDPDISVPLSQELIRISRLPRRSRSDQERAELARELTEAYRRPGGEMSLRPVQAETLLEAGTLGGAFCPQGVGAGKTIPSILCSVGNAERPLLVIPAGLVSKTERDRRRIEQHFVAPTFLKIFTYEWLGREQAESALEEYRPDLVALDEAHYASNIRGAAVARRLHRYARAHPEVSWLIFSGTLTKRSVKDYAHLVLWALKDQAPVPRNYQDLDLWADALDERKNQTKRADPGYLEIFLNEEEKKIWKSDRRAAARSAFRRRLVETPGVIATEASECDATITVRAVEPPYSAETESAFAELRRDWLLPDGKKCMDGLEVARHARELNLGFYLRWDPWPPEDWVIARRAWSTFVRQVLKHSRKLDSELQVRRAYPDQPELVAWKAIEPSFQINTVPVWLDDGPIELCAEWARRERGIIWVGHIAFGERLERDYGLVYYGKQGRDRRGRFIDDHPPSEPLVSSIKSSKQGRNLQPWSRNLVALFPPNGRDAEQLIGRTHRPGQEADEVTVDVVCGCTEVVGAVWQSVADARYMRDTLGQDQKMLLAGLDVPGPDEVAGRRGPRWRKED